MPALIWTGTFLTDYDGKESTFTAFHMAIFSPIVAVSLITTNLAGIEAFHISPELLGFSVSARAVGRAARERAPIRNWTRR
jgi:hypothetical protein